MAAMRKSATRNNSAAIAADVRDVEKVGALVETTVSVETADVEKVAEKTDAEKVAEIVADAFEGIKNEKLFSEYARNNIGVVGNKSARVGKGTRAILDEMIAKARTQYGSIVADDATRALAIEVHKAVIGRRVRESGYVQFTASEAARELVTRVSEEREIQRGNKVVGIERYKAWFAEQKKNAGTSASRSGGGNKIDVEGARTLAAAAIAEMEAQAQADALAQAQAEAEEKAKAQEETAQAS